jgi:hypothetical protein
MEGLQKQTCDVSEKKQNPFEKFKDLKEEVWEIFAIKCESLEFVANSEYTWQH